MWLADNGYVRQACDFVTFMFIHQGFRYCDVLWQILVFMCVMALLPVFYASVADERRSGDGMYNS